MAVKGNKASQFFWQLIGNLPLVLPVILAIFSGVTIALMLTTGLETGLFWTIGTLLSIPAVWLVWTRHQEKLTATELKHRRIFDVLVIVGATLWVVVNLFFTAQDVFVTRDPGVYAVTGKWMMTHQTTDIKTPPINLKENGLINYSGGIWLTTTPDKTIVQPQGMHLLPALLGMAGRAFGEQAIFKANVFFGGLALLALYGFARMILRPGWAALATLILGASLPFMYFSRHTYTEIIALALTFGALSVLWIAQSRPKDTKLWLWLLAGFMIGAGALVRPDAYLSVVAVAIYLVVVTALSVKKEHGLWIKRSVIYLLAAAVPMALAILDLRKFSHSYAINVKTDTRIQLGLLAAVLGIGIIVIALSWRTKILSFLDVRTKNWRGLVAGILIVTGLALLMLRPIIAFSVFHGANNTGQLYGYSVRQQTNINTSPKLVRLQTMDWISWYIGMPMLLLGFVGMAIAASRVMRDRAVKLLPFLMVIGLTLLMYGLIPRISLDQIWAIRRFLPVAIPGLIIFGLFAVQVILANITIEARLKKTIIAFIAIFAVLIPLSVSRPFLFVKEGENNLAYLKQLCEIFPDNAQVIWLGGSLELDATQSTRAFCGNYTLGYGYRGRPEFKETGRLDKNDLRSIAANNKAANRPTILVVRSNRPDDMAKEDRDLFTKVIDYKSQQLELSFTGVPRESIDVTDGFEIATLDANGNLAKYTAATQQ